jgi:hypothetical protein
MSNEDHTPVTITQATLNEISARYAYLEALISELRLEKETLEQNFLESETKVHTLQSTVLDYGSRIKELEAKPAHTKTHEPKMPDPPVFSGERKAVLPFLAKCRLKFTGQPSMFPTEHTKVVYAGSRLEGPPFAWFTPLNDRMHKPGETPPTELATFDDFAKALTTLYGDPHLSLTAEREIRALKQLTSVAVYIARFEEHRQYLTWNDDALRDQFYLGLRDRMKDSMAPLDRPKDLASLKELALRLDARLDARWQEKQATGNTSNPTPRPSWNNRPQTLQPPSHRQTPAIAINNPASSTPATPAPSAPSVPKPNFPSHTPDGTIPMELGSRGWQLTAAEKQRRRDNNLCNYCADPSHRAFQCPLAPPSNRPLTGNPRFQRQAVMNIDITDPSASSSPSISGLSYDTPSENAFTRE